MRKEELCSFVPFTKVYCAKNVLYSLDQVLVHYLEDIGDSGLCSQDETWVRLDVSIFSCL